MTFRSRRISLDRIASNDVSPVREREWVNFIIDVEINVLRRHVVTREELIIPYLLFFSV